MQDPEVAAALQAAARAPHLPQEEQNLRCPRCDSTNTKFCYYNNYNLSQPRHFCKSCRRYWTKGGTLRNIPIGGGTRKSSKRGAPASSAPSAPHAKRARTSSSAPAAVAGCGSGPFAVEPLPALYSPVDADRRMLDITGSFTSLLASSGHFVGLLDSFHSGLLPGTLGRPSATDPTRRPLWSSSLQLHSPSSGSESGAAAVPPPPTQPQPAPLLENFLGLQGEPGYWNGNGGWPDLIVYTPGSSFQ